jgi:diguanylate cyclase (GGDEF)-like protein
MNARADDLLSSYMDLFQTLAPGLRGVCLFDEQLALWESAGKADAQAAKELLGNRGWEEDGARANAVAKSRNGILTLALPLQRSSGQLLAVVCVQFRDEDIAEHPAAKIIKRLKPALSCLRRELANRKSRALRERASSAERTAELEWLFEFSSTSEGPGTEQGVLDRLLAASAQRLNAEFAALVVPDRPLQPEYSAAGSANAATLREALAQVQAHLLAFAHLRKRPLVANAESRARAAGLPACKILSVPVAAKSGRMIGVLVFLNPEGAPDFLSRQLFLAKHLGRHVATLLEAQFDLMTGLLARTALEETFAALELAPDGRQRTLIYIDVDRLHLVNEVHGFELGDELVVRVAQLLGAPLVPAQALVGRITGDCFGIIVTDCTTQQACEVAQRIQEAAARIRIGTEQQPLEVSVSCGVAAFMPAPKGFARTLAAAEIACKAAKDHGRARVEIYAHEDSTMVRRHDDILIVGQLREALKNDRMVLYAQRIVPLRDTANPVGYELLVRLQTAEGEIIAPQEFLSAAQRYQLLPAIDRWVLSRALRTLGAWRALVGQSGLSFSINLSAQSIGDEAFIDQAIEQIRASGVAPSSITIEITEQTAVSNLATAAMLMRRIREIGCQVALDDFGTGMNSLAALKGLPVNRIKIDGGFVKDVLTNPRSMAAVHSIMALAQSLELDTVAEYVESEAIAQRLATLGINYGQGFAFGRPLPLDEVLGELKTDESGRMRAASIKG